MSFVVVGSELLASAAADVAGIGSALEQAGSSAAVSTTRIAVAAGDEVSAAIAELFSGHGRQFQEVSARAAAFHAQFVESLAGAGGAYGSAEALNLGLLAGWEPFGLINAPTEYLLGRPLIGNGANGAAGSGQAGGDGGL
ncbi:PE family protein, partial [Mycobacterium kiyosense]